MITTRDYSKGFIHRTQVPETTIRLSHNKFIHVEKPNEEIKMVSPLSIYYPHMRYDKEMIDYLVGEYNLILMKKSKQSSALRKNTLARVFKCVKEAIIKL